MIFHSSGNLNTVEAEVSVSGCFMFPSANILHVLYKKSIKWNLMNRWRLSIRLFA